MRPRGLKPEGAEYERLAKQEIEHYNEIFLHDASPVGEAARQSLFQPVPPAWIDVETRAAQLLRERTGADASGHVLERLLRRDGIRMLSLGSGPGGIEIALARQAHQARITCIDLSPDLVRLGQQRADQEGLNVRFEVADLNTIVLPKAEYDVVFCHASLHHVLELERVADQIKGSLREEGELIVVDVSTRNGYLMWPRTREIVQQLFQTLPPRFRLNHTAYGKPVVDETVWEADTSQTSMECIRSEDIVSILSETFQVRQFIPYFSLCRRFFDTMYGPNYDLTQPLDSAILNWIWQLDRHYLETSQLNPETFFAIYAR